MRKDLPGVVQDRLRLLRHLWPGRRREKATLKAINGLSGFGASGDHQLWPIVDLVMFEAMTRLMNDPSGAEQVTAAMGELSRRAAARHRDERQSLPGALGNVNGGHRAGREQALAVFARTIPAHPELTRRITCLSPASTLPASIMSIQRYAPPLRTARTLVAAHLAEQGCKRPLIVTDRGLAALPVTGRVPPAAAGLLQPAVFDGVLATPPVPMVMAGAAAFKAHGADCVIGFRRRCRAGRGQGRRHDGHARGRRARVRLGPPAGAADRQPLPYFRRAAHHLGHRLRKVGRSSVVSENERTSSAPCSARRSWPRRVRRP